MQTARYGWRPDQLDHRDLRWSAVRPKPGKLPPLVDLRRGCPPVYDQGELGSCTGNAIAAAVDFNRRKAGLPFIAPSRLFIYWGERQIEGTIAQDAGAEIRDGIKFVAADGVCPEAAWPYVETNFAQEPPSNAWTAALGAVVRAYARLDNRNLDELKSCLFAGDPFICGFTVFSAFESDEVARTGHVPMPDATSAPTGGHAVLAVGYDNKEQHFILRNSWGPGWGAAGYFFLPYAYLTDPNLADDFWHVTATGYGPAQP